MDEQTALAELDRRGREAGTRLRIRRRAHHRRAERAGASLASSAVVSLGIGRGARRRRWWLAAAAVAVIVAGVAGYLQLRGGQSDLVLGGDRTYLVPDDLPPTFEPALVTQGDSSATAGKTVLVAYGEPSRADPWDGPTLFVHLVHGAEFHFEDSSDRVTIQGHDARVSRFDDSWSVAWNLEEGSMVVTGRDVGRDAVVTAAREATTEPAIDAEGLPGDSAEVARGPLDAARVPWYLAPFQGQQSSSA
jgi:hypothetical protein